MRKLRNIELQRLSVAEFKETEKLPIVLIADNIRSALNIGSIFRTADAFAIEAVILCGICVTPPHREILKTALGSAESVRWEYYETTQKAVDAFREKGYGLIALEQAEGTVDLRDFEWDSFQKYAILLGNEVDGVTESIMQQIDIGLEIPQFGTKHSLNVAVSAGIVLWDFVVKKV